MTKRIRVAGVDGARKGWVAVVLLNGTFETAVFDPTLEGLIEHLGPLDAMAIDIPIGLPRTAHDWPRPADLEARRLLGARRSSVFLAPPLPVLKCETWEAANRLLRELTGKGLSRQSWALFERISEADALASAHGHVHELHPEVSFHALHSAPLRSSKKTWNGLELRRILLQRAGIDLPAKFPEPAGLVAPDDLLDAAAAAWSAHRIATGQAQTLGKPTPGHPNPHAGWIWY